MGQALEIMAAALGVCATGYTGYLMYRGIEGLRVARRAAQQAYLATPQCTAYLNQRVSMTQHLAQHANLTDTPIPKVRQIQKLVDHALGPLPF